MLLFYFDYIKMSKWELFMWSAAIYVHLQITWSFQLNSEEYRMRINGSVPSPGLEKCLDSIWIEDETWNSGDDWSIAIVKI